MGELHKAVYNGHVGYYNPRTGRVRFGKCIYPNIATAIKYLKTK
jgi:hypothetical protein